MEVRRMKTYYDIPPNNTDFTQNHDGLGSESESQDQDNESSISRSTSLSNISTASASGTGITKTKKRVSFRNDESLVNVFEIPREDSFCYRQPCNPALLVQGIQETDPKTVKSILKSTSKNNKVNNRGVVDTTDLVNKMLGTSTIGSLPKYITRNAIKQMRFQTRASQPVHQPLITRYSDNGLGTRHHDRILRNVHSAPPRHSLPSRDVEVTTKGSHSAKPYSSSTHPTATNGDSDVQNQRPGYALGIDRRRRAQITCASSQVLNDVAESKTDEGLSSGHPQTTTSDGTCGDTDLLPRLHHSSPYRQSSASYTRTFRFVPATGDSKRRPQTYAYPIGAYMDSGNLLGSIRVNSAALSALSIRGSKKEVSGVSNGGSKSAKLYAWQLPNGTVRTAPVKATALMSHFVEPSGRRSSPNAISEHQYSPDDR